MAIKGKFSRRQVTRQKSAGRFESAGDAAKELHEHLNAWTSGLSRYGQQAAFALIAANWAVHGTRAAILSNRFAKLSIAAAVLYLGIHLLLVGFFVFLVRQRHLYADKDKARWAQEYLQQSNGKSVWPYTRFIERTGEVMWCLHVLGPVLSGTLLVISFFTSAPAAVPQKTDPNCVVRAAENIGPQHLGAVAGFVPGAADRTEAGDKTMSLELAKTADLWIRNRKLGQQGLLLIVGASDRVALGKTERERFDANIGLAQARAEEIRRELFALISSKDVNAVPSFDQVLVLAAGPRHSPVLERCDACAKMHGFPDDRRVDIWAIWSEAGVKKDCRPMIK